MTKLEKWNERKGETINGKVVICVILKNSVYNELKFI